MDFIKIQMELLKDYGKSKTKFIVTRKNGNVYVSPAGLYFVVIPESEYLLNVLEKPDFKGFDEILKDIEKDGLTAVVTDFTLKKESSTYVKLHTEQFDLWINQQRLKLFGKPELLKIIAYSPNKPAFIYQLDPTVTLLGGIPPFILRN